jgi:hypothetical protein
MYNDSISESRTHRIYDAGIQFLKSATTEQVNRELGISLDLSCAGYVWEDAQKKPELRGAQHYFSTAELYNEFPVVRNFIEKNVHYACQCPQISNSKIFEIAKNNFNSIFYFPTPWPSLAERLTIEQMIELGCPDNYLPDDCFPYKKLSDNEIFAAVPDIENLTGHRTVTALSVIRSMRNPAPLLSKLHVIYRTSWRATTTDIKIGQTNGRGGYCKSACFLSWK